MGQSCTPEEAEVWLEADLESAERDVQRLVKVPLTDNQYAALVSFVFNIGAPQFTRSTLLRKLNDGDYDAVPVQLKCWIFDNKKIQKGLVRRRAAEAALWSMK
jgi:lysozyme